MEFSITLMNNEQKHNQPTHCVPNTGYGRTSTRISFRVLAKREIQAHHDASHTHSHTHAHTAQLCCVRVRMAVTVSVCVCVCSLRFLVVCHWLRWLCRLCRLCRLSVNHRRCTAHGNQFVFGCVTRCVLHAVARQSPLRVWTKERESSIENLSNIFWTNNLKWCVRHCDCQFFTIYFLCFNKHQNEWIEMHKLCEWTKCNQFMQFQ